ncbi:MAG TPA: exo-beta-N-acetylmuramidase NamZ domain-containing protein, partial [Gemmatimonadaceae bacterium]
MARYRLMTVPAILLVGACTVTSHRLDVTSELPQAKVKPGITVLLDDSLELLRGRRIGLLTNQTGIDEKRESDIDLLRGPKAQRANVKLTMLFSPEHGIRGEED